MIPAKFIGENSCGYEKNWIYMLDIHIYGDYLWACGTLNKCENVPYTSLESFLNNWELLIPTSHKDDFERRNK